jgi:hypothetical protein
LTMKMFRTIYFRKFMAVAIGLLVLNMSLFLAEVEALKLLKNGDVKSNIYKLWAAAGNEEEQDFAGSPEEESLEKETLLFTQIIADFCSVNDPKDQTLHFWAIYDTKSAFRETLSPPPKG